MRAKAFSLRIGNTKLWFWLPRVRAKHFDDIIDLNDHKIYPYYGEGGPRMWPKYGVCIKCGHSILFGADACFSAYKCGQMD